MVWALGILVVGVIALGLWAARGHLGQLGPQLPERPGPDLPDGPVSAEDLRAVRFAGAFCAGFATMRPLRGLRRDNPLPSRGILLD